MSKPSLQDEFFFVARLAARFPTEARGAYALLLAAAGEQRVALYRTQGGAGMSWPLGDNAQIYGFADFTADISGALDKRYALGGGASLGIYANPTDAWQLHFTAQSQELRFGDQHREEFVMLEQSLALGQQHALRLSLRREHSWSSTWSTVMLGWHSYW